MYLRVIPDCRGNWIDVRSRGIKGEDYACEFLMQKGYVIIERNWRCGRNEIDIIARHGGVLVAVEVKTRTWIERGQPEGAVSLEQWTRIARALGIYMAESGHSWEVRFDIIAVTCSHGIPEGVNHFKDVYFPGRLLVDGTR